MLDSVRIDYVMLLVGCKFKEAGFRGKASSD